MLAGSLDTQALSQADLNTVLAVLPAQQRDIIRLARLSQAAGQHSAPVVTVVGKYNHGKSSLLNELLGEAAFAVADRRETVALATYSEQGVHWLDAPGLDADVLHADDQLAEQAIWQLSDIRLFVHAAKEGELDAMEQHWLGELCLDAQHSRRQTFFVLTQLDQLADDEQMQAIQAALHTQLQHVDPAHTLKHHAVSATRHKRGVQEGKALFIARSGIPELQAAITQALSTVPAARMHEHTSLYAQLHRRCQDAHTQAAEALSASLARQAQQSNAFEHDLETVLNQVRDDLQHTLDDDATDRALEPDSFANMFKQTAGKRERARLQIAYSRACIAIDTVLIKHGVTCLPKDQQIEVESLNSLIVAVLGISVKYRDDLRKLFIQESGRSGLKQEFKRYFTLSDTQIALKAQIYQHEAAQAHCEQAISVLEHWKPR